VSEPRREKREREREIEEQQALNQKQPPSVDSSPPRREDFRSLRAPNLHHTRTGADEDLHLERFGVRRE
jgi:hypothetical protein